MNYLYRLYHFLGGVTFALILITCVALFVIAGTWIEAITLSHQYASLLTYGNPLFAMLLWGFFINILFSATRRYPFKVKHIPFLITHLGLLMMLSGAISKHYFGLQATMFITEGTGSHLAFKSGSYALHIEKQGDTKPIQHSLSKDQMNQVAIFNGLRLQLIDITPHSMESFETWFKEDQLTISGLPPMPVHQVDKDTLLLPISGNAQFSQNLNLYAIRTMEEFVNDLKTKFEYPFLAIIENEHRDFHFIGQDQDGRFWQQTTFNGHPDSIIAYDHGFKGYSVKIDIPIFSTSSLQKPLSQALADGTTLIPPLELIKKASHAAGVDFTETCIAFLKEWDKGASWLFQEETSLSDQTIAMLTHLDWNLVPKYTYQGCLALCLLLDRLEDKVNQGKSLLEVLEIERWPLLSSLKDVPQDIHAQLAIITAQVFAAAEQMLEIFLNLETKGHSEAQMLSAYLRSYEIHLKTMLPPLNINDPSIEKIPLEATISPVHISMPSQVKLEENFPKVTMHARKDHLSEIFTLIYDPTASGLKWPILQGQYLLRLQQAYEEIPYHIRLRQARQLNYANSTQSFSFESDLLMTDRRTGAIIEKTISMNQPLETWDGYRFYLSTMSPSTEIAVKRIQLTVNLDPGKYWLTYPGAFFLSCGIVGLFLIRQRRT